LFVVVNLFVWLCDWVFFEFVVDVLCGGVDVVVIVGCYFVGGYSIDDFELKYGFVVIGIVDFVCLLRNDVG